MRKRQAPVTAVILSFAAGCGAPQAPAAPPEATATAAPSSSPSSAAAEDDDDDRPPAEAGAAPPPPAQGAASGAILPLENLLGKPKPGAAKDFPKATATDKECTDNVGLVGKFDKDYDAIVAACGPATGLKEFTRKVTGSLDPQHRSDTYDFQMLGGYCYRFIAVGDESLEHLDIRVQRPNGALVSMHQGDQPLTLIDPRGTWCKTHDREFHLVVATRGNGHGKYSLGIWARPK